MTSMSKIEQNLKVLEKKIRLAVKQIEDLKKAGPAQAKSKASYDDLPLLSMGRESGRRADAREIRTRIEKIMREIEKVIG